MIRRFKDGPLLIEISGPAEAVAEQVRQLFEEGGNIVEVPEPSDGKDLYHPSDDDDDGQPAIDDSGEGGAS